MGNDTCQNDLYPGPEELLSEAYVLFDDILSGTGKLKINVSIAKMVQELDEKYGVSKNDLLHIIFTNYLRTKSYQRFDPAKAKLVTYLLKITTNQLNMIWRDCNAGHMRFDRMISWEEFYAGSEVDEEDRLGYSLGYWERRGVAGLSTQTTPEDILAEKELRNLFEGHYGKFDADVIREGKDRKAAAEELGMEYFSYCKRLQRIKTSFTPVLAGAGYIN
jgi:hypothetical protein